MHGCMFMITCINTFLMGLSEVHIFVPSYLNIGKYLMKSDKALV